MECLQKRLSVESMALHNAYRTLHALPDVEGTKVSKGPKTFLL